MGYRLGIDLGTTFTAAACIEDAGPRMIELGNRNLTTPSVLFLTDDGTLLFGEIAERRASAEPERVLREFKRRIGDTVPLVIGDRTFDPITLQSELLRWVLQVTEDRLGAPPDHVVVTHPANWGLFKVQLMRDIATAAGIPGASLCPEPVAAAIEYAAKERVPVGAKIAVYDLGGGTFDVAVLEKTQTGFEIVGTPLGVDHLGGSDFDEALLADAVAKLALQQLDPDDTAVARGLAALRRECIEAKETLSIDIATDVTALLPGAGRPLRLTRSEFEGLIRPALEESIRTTVRALRLAGVDNADLHAVVLAGGSSRIPLVTELLTHELAVPVAADTFPKHDLAMGAARYALLQTQKSAGSSAASPTRPSHDSGPFVPEAPDDDASPPASEAATRLPGGGARQPSATGRPSTPPEPARKRSARLLITIIVVCVVVATGVAVAGLRSRTTPSADPPASPSAENAQTPAVPSPTISPQQPQVDLPAGAPLPATQLLVPRYKKVTPPSRLWLTHVDDPTASRQIETVQPGSVYGVGLSPDRRTITYIDAGRAIRVMSSAGKDNRQLFKSPAGCGTIRHASWSPINLSTFVLECQQDSSSSQLVVVNIDGQIVRPLETKGLHASDPTISPDGRSVVFWASKSATKNEGGSILKMPIDGSTRPQRITDSATDADSDPAWSPDGTTLAFRRRVGPAYSEGTSGNTSRENTDILLVSASGGLTRTLISGPATDDKPAWSPDGRTIAFVSDRTMDGSKTNRKDLWLVPSAGGEPSPLRLTSPRYAGPTWWHR